MKDKTMYFISGVSGVGKTSIINHLKVLLDNNYEVHDFDERGVPSGANHDWRIEETKYWIQQGTEKTEDNIRFIVCGFANPDEIENIQKDFPGIKIKTILLDGEDEVIENRLRNRNEDKNVQEDLQRVVGSTEEFIQNNRKFTPILRSIFKKHSYPIIDTTHITPEKVAEEVMKFIK